MYENNTRQLNRSKVNLHLEASEVFDRVTDHHFLGCVYD